MSDSQRHLDTFDRALPPETRADHWKNGLVTAELPLELIVLSSLLDDVESIDSMRSHGEVAPYGLALVDRGAVAAEVRRLLNAGLVEALVLGPGTRVEIVESSAAREQVDLSSDWFRPTYRGWQRLWDHHDEILAYWGAQFME